MVGLIVFGINKNTPILSVKAMETNGDIAAKTMQANQCKNNAPNARNSPRK